MPRRLDPGPHRLTVEAAGFEPWQATVTLSEGAVSRVAASLEPIPKDIPPPAPEAAIEGPSTPLPVVDSPPVSPWVIAGFATSGGALLVGSATGIASLVIAGQVQDQCVQDICPTATQSDARTATTLAHVSTASFVLAGAGAGLGLISWLLPADGEDQAVRWQPVLGPGSLAVKGAF